MAKIDLPLRKNGRTNTENGMCIHLVKDGPLRNGDMPSPDNKKDRGQPKLQVFKENQFFHWFLRFLPHLR